MHFLLPLSIFALAVKRTGYLKTTGSFSNAIFSLFVLDNISVVKAISLTLPAIRVDDFKNYFTEMFFWVSGDPLPKLLKPLCSTGEDGRQD